MKPILSIPIVIIILVILMCEMIVLSVPLCIMYSITGKDYSKSWMVMWAEKPLKKWGIKI